MVRLYIRAQLRAEHATIPRDLISPPQFRILESFPMFITPAYAQAAGGGGNPLLEILPMLLAVGAIMYFLVYRPQKKQMRERQEMLAGIRRNDSIVTGGGVVGKVTKVIDDNEVEVQIAPDVKVRVLRAHIADVRVKGEPAKGGAKTVETDAEPEADNDTAAKPAKTTPKTTRRRRKT